MNRDFIEICSLFDLAPNHGQSVLGQLREQLEARLEESADG
ncbi:hypothetical protein [Solemya velesiana gill symbiont]|nr:hypothetical protein [Solemya velesiana gill symbiont]